MRKEVFLGQKFGSRDILSSFVWFIAFCRRWNIWALGSRPILMVETSVVSVFKVLSKAVQVLQAVIIISIVIGANSF